MRTAHRLAKHSFSTVLYLFSLFESFRLRYSTGRSSPPTTWARTAPSPLSNASVCTKKGRSKLGECRSGPPHRAAFTLVRACWHGSVHWTAFFSKRSTKASGSSWGPIFISGTWAIDGAAMGVSSRPSKLWMARRSSSYAWTKSRKRSSCSCFMSISA